MKIKRVVVIVFFAMVVLSLYSCNIQPGEEEAAPVLYSISPQTKVSHLPDFTMLVTGEHFKQGSVVVFNGRETQTQYVSSTALNCRIETEDITPGSAAVSEGNTVSRVSSREVNVFVRNPSTGGDSNALSFTITDNHTFTAPVNITNHGQGYLTDFDMEVDESGGIYISYLTDQLNPSIYGIYLKKSGDSGLTWEQEVQVPNVSANYSYHDLAVGSTGNIDVVWKNNDFWGNMYLSRSTNGVTWLDPVQVNEQPQEQDIYLNHCSITTDQAGNIYSIYEEFTRDSKNVNLLASRSTDNGVTWTTPVTIFSKAPLKFPRWLMEDLYPGVTADTNGHIYAFWTGLTFTGTAIIKTLYSSRSLNSGITWSQPVVISSPLSEFGHYIALAPDGNINLLRIEADYELYFQRFSGNGAPLGDVIEVLHGGELTIKLGRAIAVDGAGNINILFRAESQDSGSGLYFSRSLDNGQTWSQPLSIPYQYPLEEFEMRVDNAGNIYIAIFYYGEDAPDIFFSRSNQQ